MSKKINVERINCTKKKKSFQCQKICMISEKQKKKSVQKTAKVRERD